MTVSKYSIRGLADGDVWHVASNMRARDVEEVWAASHFTPTEALRMSIAVSRDTVFVGVADGIPVCIYGVEPPSLLGLVARPWMLGTDGIDFHSREFLRRSRSLTRGLSERFPVMENYVDARNEASIRWLRWVGFSVYHPEPWGRDLRPFRRFRMEA